MNTTTSASITSQRSLQAWLLLGLTALIWGSSFILIKRSLVGFSPMQVGTGRIFFAFLFFLPYLFVRIRQFPKGRWLPLFGSGALGYLAPAILFATAGAHMNSSLSGALNALSPLFTLLIGAFFFQNSIKQNQVIGILLGFGGSVFLLFVNSTGVFAFNEYTLLIVIATICYGFNTNIVSRYLKGLSAVRITAFPFIFTGPIALLSLMTTDFPDRTIYPTSAESVLTLATLGILGSGLASIIFNWVIQLTSAVFASTVTYLMPIVALLWGILDGEPLYWPQITGMTISLIGILLITRN